MDNSVQFINVRTQTMIITCLQEQEGLRASSAALEDVTVIHLQCNIHIVCGAAALFLATAILQGK